LNASHETPSPTEQTSQVGSLTHVLQAVVGDADEANGQADGRIPVPIDDSVEVGG
jgi:hypothetical protein